MGNVVTDFVKGLIVPAPVQLYWQMNKPQTGEQPGGTVPSTTKPPRWVPSDTLLLVAGVAGLGLILWHSSRRR